MQILILIRGFRKHSDKSLTKKQSHPDLKISKGLKTYFFREDMHMTMKLMERYSKSLINREIEIKITAILPHTQDGYYQNIENKPGIVAHVYNPTYTGG
jgi:hypothetical protein